MNPDQVELATSECLMQTEHKYTATRNDVYDETKLQFVFLDALKTKWVLDRLVTHSEA